MLVIIRNSCIDLLLAVNIPPICLAVKCAGLHILVIPLAQCIWRWIPQLTENHYFAAARLNIKLYCSHSFVIGIHGHLPRFFGPGFCPHPLDSKQSVRQLVGQNQGVSSVEITDQNIKSFERTARKYGVDFALKKDRSVSPPKYLVFFKARDNDALTAAFTEYTAKTLRHTEKPSLLAQLKNLTALTRSAPARAKDRDLTL